MGGRFSVRLLLDTHVVLWALNHVDRLSTRARDVLQDPTNELMWSAVTPWEIATKHRLGPLPGGATLVDAYPEHLARLGAGDLPVTSRHALLAGRLEWGHRDPFDRMLAAQSILEGVPLVTSDRVFSTLPGVNVLW